MTGMDAQYRRYLSLLRLPAVRPDVAGLREVVRRHLVEIPFENVSKRLQARQGARTIPELPAFLDGVERHRFGGTCYANNYHLFQLLRHLGFDARLCGGDMPQGSDVHVAVMVACEGREYLVDCGFGAPFLEPLPLDVPTPQVVTLGRERYVLHPRDAAGASRVDFFRHGELRYGYRLRPAARDLREFAAVIAASYAPDAFFMNTLHVVRFSGRGAVSLKGRTLTHNIGGRSFTETIGEAELPGLVQTVFGIPADMVQQALAATPARAG